MADLNHSNSENHPTWRTDGKKEEQRSAKKDAGLLDSKLSFTGPKGISVAW